MEEKAFKTSIGGQALLEGIMMRGPEKTCMAVRKQDGEITTECAETKKNPAARIPFVRGVAAMIISLSDGYKWLMKSSDIAFPDGEQEDKFDKFVREKFGKKTGEKLSVIAALLGALLAVALFVVLPTFFVGELSKAVDMTLGIRSLLEGVLKVVIFIGYLFFVTRVKEIHRVFEYHGAEHKTIACYEHRDELTPENVRKYSRFHPRCGTSFIFIVLIVSIIVTAFVPFSNTWARAGVKLLLLPLIMGFSYEIIKYAGAHDNVLSKILSAPGLFIQRLTAFEPDEEQMEVAITALKAVLPKEPEC